MLIREFARKNHLQLEIQTSAARHKYSQGKSSKLLKGKPSILTIKETKFLWFKQGE